MVGSLVGAIAATAAAAYGTVSCIFFTGLVTDLTYMHSCIHTYIYVNIISVLTKKGIIRTPSAIVAMAAGKRWDDDAEEWIH